MCGFLVYKEKGNNFYIQRRGQDATCIIKRNGFTFVHNLLSVTGEVTPQPFEKNGIVCLFNGEIYNHSFVRSDGENLIPLYEKYGFEFPKYLDGEWALALYDFDKGLALFATDLFATKPLWRNGLECASYESGISGHKISANTIEVVYFTGKTSYTKIYGWDLTQHKSIYDDWIKAFEKSISKRAEHNCFIGLSSGYDSGAIACEMAKQKISFKAYCIKGLENTDIQSKRMELLSEFEHIDYPINSTNEKRWLDENIEHFSYKLKTKKSLHEDSASLGLSIICGLAHKEGRKVYLSGQGADEILADYSLFPYQSTYKGKFPEKLELWENFYDGAQYSYLGKEEYVAGSHSIETRYPFLDREVVQEFLWLIPELKNKYYKAPLRVYLEKNGYPFEKDVKIGLNHLR